MTSTISDGTTTLTPDLVDGYAVARESRNIVHAILGTNEPAVTLRPAALRTGTLRIVVGNDDDLAAAFVTLLASGVVLMFSTSDRTVVEMTFVVTDEITAEMDTVRSVWIITCGFQEVA